MGVGVGIFLMVLGAILAFAMKTDVPGINVNTLGVILLLIGLVAFVYSLVFWSALTPWGRSRRSRPTRRPPCSGSWTSSGPPWPGRCRGWTPTGCGPRSGPPR